MDIDDLVRYPTVEKGTWYARLSPAFPALWGPLIEKAWAKSFSNYKTLTRGGYSMQSMRALNGAPTERYYVGRYYPWSLFVSINNSKVYGYFHNLETRSSLDGSGDTRVNECGVAYSHAYSLLDTFQLQNIAGDVVESFYVVRDPRGPLANTDWNGRWNVNDTSRWTGFYKDFVGAKYGFDPTDYAFFKESGIFLVAWDEIGCFM